MSSLSSVIATLEDVRNYRKYQCELQDEKLPVFACIGTIVLITIIFHLTSVELMTCLNYFYQLLSRRDYSVNELQKKGQEKGYSQSDIAEAINDLQSKDYQSDTRLIAQLISSSQGKYGKSAIKRKCLEKGIDANLFEQVWMEQQETEESEETEQLVDLKAKVMRKYKLEDFQNIDPKTKTKVFNYLNYRGFNAFEVLAQWQREGQEPHS